ncbi:MAG TPA: hypothetical protein VF179_31290 [Thermoanaerobaculia bacterium]|nr:hypothetical protein [Thermoanaerobaculia bacterium]
MFIICIVLLAIVCTVVGAVLAWRDQESPHRFFLAIAGALVGLMALVGGIAYETHHTLETSVETSRFIHDRLDLLLNLPGDTQRDFVREYSAKTIDISRFKNAFLSRQGATLENDFRGKYSQLANGIIEVPDDRIMSMAMDLTRESRKEILATSLFSTDWKSKWSSEYWQLQQDRIKKDNILLHRIFILSGQPQEQCEPVFREHHRAGVKVSFVDSSVLGESEIRDLMIIDESMAAELIFGVGDRVVGGKVIVDPQQVENYRNLFRSIEAKAEGYRPAG